MSTKFVVYYDSLLVWHFEPVTIFYCDIPTQSGRIFRPPQKMHGLSQRNILTHRNFGQPMAVTFCPLLILISFGFFAFKDTLP